MFSPDIHTEIYADSLWDKIFVTGTVAALGHALGDIDFNVRTNVVKLFTAAIAQGALSCFHGIFIPICLQRAFGT